MEIDPDVAELLDDLPPSRLPQPLKDQGWGNMTIKEAVSFGIKGPKAPSTTQAPVFNETCAQCGRPITLDDHDRWVDHIHRTLCDGAIAEHQEFDHHVNEHDLQEHRRKQAYLAAWERSKLESTTPPSLNCLASKDTRQCKHRCFHPNGHFGFHECFRCRHLWR